MRTKELNLFILADNALVVNGLRHFLEDRFGASVRISQFFDVKSFLKQVSHTTDAVVVDYSVEGKKGSDIIKAVKDLNPHTEAIFHSSNEEIAATVRGLIREVNSQPAPVSYAFKLDDQYNHYYARALNVRI